MSHVRLDGPKTTSLCNGMQPTQHLVVQAVAQAAITMETSSCLQHQAELVTNSKDGLYPVQHPLETNLWLSVGNNKNTGSSGVFFNSPPLVPRSLGEVGAEGADHAVAKRKRVGRVCRFVYYYSTKSSIVIASV